MAILKIVIITAICQFVAGQEKFVLLYALAIRTLHKSQLHSSLTEVNMNTVLIQMTKIKDASSVSN